MPKVPDDAVRAAAEVMLRQYESEFSVGHLTWADFTDPAREILEAAAPLLAGHVATAITAHMEEHGARMPETMARRYRRHLGIAAQVAAGAFATEADLKRNAAEHLNALFAVAKLREDIAALIVAQKVPCAEHPPPFPKPSCLTCGRNGAFHRAAMIAAGLRDDLEAKATEGSASGGD